jgi:FKBP-type peptidyl-prolyl cis-trans isomerase 2
MTVKKGDKIKVDYVGTFEDGTEFDASKKHGEPLEFEVGAGMMIKGFDDAVIGMNVGDSKDIIVQPDEGYGQINDQLVQKIPKENIGGELEPKIGMMVGLQSPDGKQFPAKIIEVDDKDITVDINHPLAGKVLNFNITLVEIVE